MKDLHAKLELVTIIVGLVFFAFYTVAAFVGLVRS